MNAVPSLAAVLETVAGCLDQVDGEYGVDIREDGQRKWRVMGIEAKDNAVLLWLTDLTRPFNPDNYVTVTLTATIEPPQ